MQYICEMGTNCECRSSSRARCRTSAANCASRLPRVTEGRASVPFLRNGLVHPHIMPTSRKAPTFCTGSRSISGWPLTSTAACVSRGETTWVTTHQSRPHTGPNNYFVCVWCNTALITCVWFEAQEYSMVHHQLLARAATKSRPLRYVRSPSAPHAKSDK